MANNQRLRSHNREQKDDKKLWKELKIDFHLEALQFPDNKIYGTIQVTPESSRRLIKNFVLVVNKTKRFEFDSQYKNISASGFNTQRKNPSAYIEAIPSNATWAHEPKQSKLCYFYFTGEVFALSPTISFDWWKDKKYPKAILIIKWFHIGDKLANRYIIYLDDVEIQHIRQKLIDDAFLVSIYGFEPGESHTLQLAARLYNGKETYRSDLMEFTVPDKQSFDKNEPLEFITVSDDLPPPNLPVLVSSNDNTNDDLDPDTTEQTNNGKPSRNVLKKQYTCCDQMPHEQYPGIEHYFMNAINRHSSSSLSLKGTINKNKQPTTSNQSDEENDDDDVVMTNN